MALECPISSVDLPGIGDLPLTGLVVVLGPNSSGKTQLLRDLNEVVCGRRRALVVASGVTLRPLTSLNDSLDLLCKGGILQPSSADTFQAIGLQHGTDQGKSGQLHKAHVESYYDQYVRAAKQKTGAIVPESNFLQALGPMLCSALFLGNRLTLLPFAKVM